MRLVLLLLVASSALAAVHPRYKRAWGDALPDIGAPGYTCDAELMKPSATVPTSVHSVRPADIKVIGALGDSLTAANGAGAEDPIAILLQYRGLNFQCGGDRELEDHITMTSILKKYNPKLFGQSYGIGAADVYDIAQFNIAQPGAVASDLPKQARLLVDRLNSHQQDFDMQNDWKLINIFIGGNDVCNYCRNPESKSPANFKKGIQDAVQILYDNVPRVIVSLLSMLHLEMVRVIDGGEFFCSELHVIGECKCEGNASFSNANVSAICTAYQDVEKQLETEGTFERDDFTLVVQQFFNNVTKPPLLDDGTPDLRFFAPDCFHFAQYGHAISASWLWRNLLEPVDGKTLRRILPKQICPWLVRILNVHLFERRETARTAPST